MGGQDQRRPGLLRIECDEAPDRKANPEHGQTGAYRSPFEISESKADVVQAVTANGSGALLQSRKLQLTCRRATSTEFSLQLSICG
jgi:hypothetical protein